MNWCTYTALLATLLTALIDCPDAAATIERNPTAASPSPIKTAAGLDERGAAEQTTDPIADEDEKLTISKIMKLAHKSGLLKKVATGKATDAEVADLHKFYSAMPELTPPKGEEKSWQEKTAALTAASKAAVDKDPNAGALLKAATNCTACHALHKN